MDDVRRLAKRALDVLAIDKTKTPEAARTHLVSLCDAFTGPDIDQCHDALARIQKSGISRDDIVDHVLPGAARLMGERWFADEISFVEVTIGTARLQEAVRSLAAQNRLHDAHIGRAKAPRVLMVLPRGEDHSFGLIVATDQLRRLGYHVDIAVDQTPTQIARLVRNTRFDFVGIGVVSRRTLALAKDIVEKIRMTVTNYTPIVISGVQFATDKDVIAATGADHVVRDVRTALKVCGRGLGPMAAADTGGAEAPEQKMDAAWEEDDR